MLIAADSCSTLVTLDGEDKQCFTNDSTPILCVERRSSRSQVLLSTDVLSIPHYLSGCESVEEYLRLCPEYNIMDSRDKLHAKDPLIFDKSTSERILYVGQGEVAHALPHHCDFLFVVSDKATTCHILALRSEFHGNLPFTSLTHIDNTVYESCLRLIVREHLTHHNYQWGDRFGLSESRIKFQLDIVGGFVHSGNLSFEITNWILRLFATIAREYQNIEFTLRTCVVSSLNDNGYKRPITRGLAIHLTSGNIYPAKVDKAVAGPAIDLRAARVWSVRHTLSVIHTSSSGSSIQIEPFSYTSTPDYKRFLYHSDEVLLQLTSTSPDVEEEGFCDDVRSMARFVLEVPCYKVFGRHLNKSLLFKRVGTSNIWTRSH